MCMYILTLGETLGQGRPPKLSDSVKYHLPVGYAADLTSVVGAREAGASWNARRMVETVWKLERGVDFSGGKEYGERASGRTPGKMA